MKNIIFIDIDSDRKKVVQIGKPTDTPKPTNAEEAKKMILDDLACTFEGFCTLIHVADQNKYGSKEDLIGEAIKYLNNMLIVSPPTYESGLG